MDKGTRVRITSGSQGQGATGTVFWTGPSRYGEGLRLGVRGDDGQTYWVDQGDVEETDAAPPPVEAGPTFDKGDRVAFESGGREGTGTVFWTGQSRQGPGQRLGIRDDEGEEAVWLDARFARPLTNPEEDEAAPWDPNPETPEMPPLDDGPPLDDAYIDVLASQVDDEGGDVPPDW